MDRDCASRSFVSVAKRVKGGGGGERGVPPPALLLGVEESSEREGRGMSLWG